MSRSTKNTTDLNAAIAALTAMVAEPSKPKTPAEILASVQSGEMTPADALAAMQSLAGNVSEKAERVTQVTDHATDDGGKCETFTVTHYGGDTPKAYKTPRVSLKVKTAGTEGSMKTANVPPTLLRFIRSDAFAEWAQGEGITL